MDDLLSKDNFFTKLLLLVITFILTTLAGGILTYYFQKRSWKRQAYLDLYKKKYDDGTKFLDELSELIGKRLFFLQRFGWAISGGDTERVERTEKEYFEVVNVWNANYYRNRNKIRLLVNEQIADLFLDYNDDSRPDNPNSLHYKFVLTHQNVMAAKNDNSTVNIALRKIDLLNYNCSEFLEKLTSEFTIRAEKMQLLEAKDLRDNFTKSDK